MTTSSLDTTQSMCLNDLIAAAVQGNSSRIHSLMGSWDDEKRKLISNSMDSEETYTPLMWAAREGNAIAVEALCSYECVVKDKKGGWNESTALMRAIERGHVEVVSSLINCKVDLNTQNKYGMTALMLTSEMSSNDKIFPKILQIIDLLIKNQADMNLKNKDGYTALTLAAEVGNTEVMKKYLTVTDIKIDAANQFGKTALILAAEFGHLNALKALVERDQPANVGILSRRGLSALMLAAVNGHSETVKYLVEKKADVFHINKRRENEGKFIYFDTALSMACNKAQLKMVKELLALAPRLCNKDFQPYNALRNACMKNDPSKRSDILEIVQLLISQGVVTEDCMRIHDDDGNTCIMHACQTGNIEVVCELLGAVTSPTGLNDAAEANKSEVLIEYLLWGVTNKEGSNAVSLLATFYKDFEDSKDREQGKPKDGLGSFLQLAVINNINHPYLLDMFKEILPLLKSPLSFMSEFKSETISKLESNGGNPAADVQLLNSLVNIAAAIKRAQDCHPEEQNELKKMFDEFEEMLMECMKSPKLDDPEIVVLLFSLDRAGIDDYNPNSTDLRVRRANALLKGPLKVCIEHNIYKVLASTQIIAHVHKVFEDSLKFNSPDHIRDFNDLFQLRSGCPTYRFNPFVMFSFESLMKLLLLVIVSLTSFTSGETTRCNTTSELTFMHNVCNYRHLFEYIIVVFWFTSLLYEIGEVLNRMRESKAKDFINILTDLRSASRRHFSDKWNIIDVITILLQAGWVLFRFALKSPVAETLLATSTITLALVILRFQSLWPETVIARMSSTIEKIEEISTELWAKIQAANAQEYVLIYERHPFCMLPAPFNLISIVVDRIETLSRQKIALDSSTNCVVSYAGTVSDKITSICFAPISAVRELHLMLEAVWTLSIPRENQLIITFFAASLALVWVILFMILIVVSTFRHENTKMNFSNRRIEFASNEDDKKPREQDNITLIFAISCLISKTIVTYLVGQNLGPSIWFGFLGAIVILFMEPSLPNKCHVTTILLRSTILTRAIESNSTHLSALENFVKKNLSPVFPTSLMQQTGNHVEKYVDYASIVTFIVLAIVVELLRIDTTLLVILCIYFLYSLYFKTEKAPPIKSKSSRNLSLSKKSIENPTVPSETGQALHMKEASTHCLIEDESTVRDDSPGKQMEAVAMRPKIRRTSGRRSTRSSIFCQTPDQLKYSDMPDTPTSSVQGKLKINILRGDLKKTGLTYFGRKVNPYVFILYGSESTGWQEAVSRVVHKGGKSPEWFDDHIRISLKKDLYELKIEVWDHHDASARSEHAWDRLLLEKDVDIKEWIANKRFDGSITMKDATNEYDETDGIQLSVRVVYDVGKVALNSTGSEQDLVGNWRLRTPRSSANSRKDILASTIASVVTTFRNSQSKKNTKDSSDADAQVVNINSCEELSNALGIVAPPKKFSLDRASSTSRLDSDVYLFSSEDRDRIFKRKKKRGPGGSGTATATASPRFLSSKISSAFSTTDSI